MDGWCQVTEAALECFSEHCLNLEAISLKDSGVKDVSCLGNHPLPLKEISLARCSGVKSSGVVTLISR